MDSVYTPNLDDYLTSLVPGVKAVDKQSKFLQDRLLDTLGPVSQLFEHIFGMLSQCQPGKTIDLTYEQLNELGSITSNAIRLLGNTSALLSQERRKAVLQKINSQGTLASLASEEFPQAGRSLFGEGFEERIRTRSETAKTLLQAASVGNRKQQFFSRPHHPIPQVSREPWVRCTARFPQFQTQQLSTQLQGSGEELARILSPTALQPSNIQLEQQGMYVSPFPLAGR